MLDLRPAARTDAERLLALREAAGAWLRGQGIRQWERGEVSAAEIRGQIGAGEWFVVGSDGGIRGALRLLWSDPEFWGDRPDDAAYVHGLEVGRRDLGGAWWSVTLLEKPLGA